MLVTLSGCNLYGGLSSPSNDEQHLDAARACLDRNDFPCALEHYQALSDSYADIRINETSLARLGQARVFSFSDLISALGTSLGNGRTLSSMAELIARRNVATAANRVLIQETYASNAQISDSNPKLRAFSKFISAISMYSTVLASAVGPDGILTASDISPGSCGTVLGDCGPTTGMPDSSTGGNPSDLDDILPWANEPSIEMLWVALAAAASEAETISSGSPSGVLSSIINLSDPMINTAPLKRQQLILILGLQ